MNIKGNREFYKKLIAFAKRHEILIVKDNPYSFVLNERPISLLSVEEAKEVAIELNSLSKTFNMAGWRVGMLLGSSQYLNEVLKVKTQQDSGMFYGIQKGAIAALKLNSDWFDYMNSIYEKRREWIWKIADKLDCEYDKNAAGMFVWCKLTNGKTSEEMVDELLYNKNIFVAPGTIFGSQGEGYIRFSLCVKKDELKEALGRL